MSVMSKRAVLVRLSIATGLIAAAASAQATTPGQFAVVSATGSQSVSITNNGNHNGGSSTGIGTTTISLDDVTGSATSAAGSGSATASLNQGGGGSGGLGGGLGGFGGNAGGSAHAHVTYEYIFTGTTPNLVSTLIRGGLMGGISCQSQGTGPCTAVLGQPTYYVVQGTTIAGSYAIDTSGYAFGSVKAYGYGPNAPQTTFTQACGYSRNSPGCTSGSDSGTFSTFGLLAVSNASLAANAFYGFIDLDATATLLEGGHARAFIDPTVSLNLPGVNPNNFTLSFSPGFTNGAVSAVPEPATWAMMILGMAAVGGALRRRAGRRLQPA